MSIVDAVQRKQEALGWYLVRDEHRIAPSAELFEELEQIVGYPLDDEYRAFLTAVGGGSFDARAQVVGLEPNPWGALTPETFFGFYDEHGYDVRHATKNYRRLLPEGFIPLVLDPGANVAVYAAGGEYRGRVYFRDKNWRAFAASHALDDVYAELDERGLETQTMDIAEAIDAWEVLHEAELTKPRRMGNLYLLANSLEDFVQRIEPYQRPEAK